MGPEINFGNMYIQDYNKVNQVSGSSFPITQPIDLSSNIKLAYQHFSFQKIPDNWIQIVPNLLSQQSINPILFSNPETSISNFLYLWIPTSDKTSKYYIKFSAFQDFHPASLLTKLNQNQHFHYSSYLLNYVFTNTTI